MFDFFKGIQNAFNTVTNGVKNFIEDIPVVGDVFKTVDQTVGDITQNTLKSLSTNPTEFLGNILNNAVHTIEDSSKFLFNLATVPFNNFIPDGEIDGSFQGITTGDCWFLSSLKSISQDPQGKELIKNAVKQKDPLNWEVTLYDDEGKSHTYNVNYFEAIGSRFDFNNMLSRGDMDVTILELATKKHYQGQGLPDDKNPLLVGGHTQQLVKLLTGMNDQQIAEKTGGNSMYTGTVPTDELLNALAADKDGFIATCAIHGDKNAHAYSIESVDSKNQTVTISNPWYSDVPITLSYKQFKGEEDLTGMQQMILGANWLDSNPKRIVFHMSGNLEL